jgi:23S rRNA (adenine2503-C2)-methyltransferase
MEVTFTHAADRVWLYNQKIGNAEVQHSYFDIYRENGDVEHHACLSTQVGCAYQCAFCYSGLNGLQRSLTANEVLSTVRTMSEMRKIENFDRLDLMGSGEFLSNPNWREILQLLNRNCYERKVSIASLGSAKKIRALAESQLPIHSFWLSLHAVRHSTRETFLPVAVNFDIPELFEATQKVMVNCDAKVRVNYLCYQQNTTAEDVELLVQLLSHYPEFTLQLSQPNGGLVVGTLSREEIISFADNLRVAGLRNRIVLFLSAKREDETGGCGTLTYHQ